MKYPCSGVILAGGMNTRFGGKEKALIRVGGRPILDRIYTIFKELFDEIILVTNDPTKYLAWDLLMVTDLFHVRSSLTGIHAGLFAARNPHIFVTACDTPFLKKEVITLLLERIDDRMDACIPETSAGLEPLCAVYAKKSLASIERHLARNLFKIQWVFRRDRLKKIPEKVFREKDNELISFYNINTPQDLAYAEKMLGPDQ